LELHRLRICGRGVRPTRLCELHAPAQSPFCGDEMSHAPINQRMMYEL